MTIREDGAHAGPRPALSVVFAASHDSPTLREALVQHKRQLTETDAELLIADGTPDGLPSDYPVSVHMPGADVFALRAAAMAQARGRIIAVTEDHCVPADDWYRAMLHAHDSRPGTPAVAGLVLNGSRKRALDWANFLMTYGPFLPPFPDPPYPRRFPPPVNLSIKREALADVDMRSGGLETEIGPQLYFSGQMALDDSVQLTHVQSHSLRSTTLAHFHNGRTTTGLRPPATLPRERMRRILSSLLLPPRVWAETAHQVRRAPGYRRVALVASPLIALLSCAHALGELVGAVAGPGDSARHLE